MLENRLILNYQPGDLLFFHQYSQNHSILKKTKLNNESNEFSQVVISSSLLDSKIYHVAMITSLSDKVLNTKNRDKSLTSVKSSFVTEFEDVFVIHATDKGVRHEAMKDIFQGTTADILEIATIAVDLKWKLKAVKWAFQQVGCAYNDIFSPEFLNSQGRRAFYCCQLISEAYKITNEAGISPFLPHKLNFHDQTGRLILYWVEYYKKKCPNNPKVPQGKPGTHPSILRASPKVHLLATFHLNFESSQTSIINTNNNYEKLADMKNFSIPKDLLKALHFINGARDNLAYSQTKKFMVFEPRSGIVLYKKNNFKPIFLKIKKHFF